MQSKYYTNTEPKLEFLEHIPCALMCNSCEQLQNADCCSELLSEYSEHAFNCSLSLTIVAHPHTEMF